MVFLVYKGSGSTGLETVDDLETETAHDVVYGPRRDPESALTRTLQYPL
jgi:hypothetical protein